MSLGAVLAGVAPGYRAQEQTNVLKDSQRLAEDKMAFDQQNQQTAQMRELGMQGYETIKQLVDNSMEQGRADPAALAKSAAPIVDRLKQIDQAAGTNYAAQASSLISGLGAQKPGMANDPTALNEQYGKPPPGYMWVPPTQPGGYPSQVKIEGGPAVQPSADQAGKLSGLDNFNLIPKDKATGEWSMGDHAKAAIDYYTGQDRFGYGSMFKAADAMKEGILRAMTGAAAPTEEQKQYASLYMIQPWDTQQTRKTKMEMARRYIETYKATIRGRTTEDLSDQERAAAHEATQQAMTQQLGATPQQILQEADAKSAPMRAKVEAQAQEEFKKEQIEAAKRAVAAGKVSKRQAENMLRERNIDVDL